MSLYKSFEISLFPPISGTTARCVLAQEGYHRRVAQQVPYLSPRHRKARMAWVKKNKELTEEDWARIIWSDECYIYLDDNKGRVYVTHRPDEVLCDDCVVPSFKESTIRVMVWGCIIKGRLGPLVVLEYPGGKGGGMNSERYQEQVLSAQLHSFYMEMEKELGSVMFQQDNAAAHASKLTAKWLKTHAIKVFGHPSNSPDLNPIERIWHVLKTIIRRRPHVPSSLEELKQAVREAWDSISVEVINREIDHMTDRVAAVLAARGGHTGF